MSPLKTYKHKDTGKVGEYSDSVAALFPKLELLEVTDEVAVEAPVAQTIAPPVETAPVSTETTGGDAKNKGKADQ
jgi:hypothetical protein